MRRKVRDEVIPAEGYQIRVLGGAPTGLRDLYHDLLRMPAWGFVLAVTGAYLALNLGFAAAYLATGGIANAQPGSFADAFFFSIQTMATIGYGAMYPASPAANVVVVIESTTGLAVVALATGLVFARFSRTRARVLFSSRAVISPVDGVPALMMRVGNERRGVIIDASFRATIMRTTRTAEGTTIYRTEDLRLVRDRAPGLQRAWLIMHRIEPGSPLHGDGPASLAASEAELTLAVTGVDETTLQLVHARRTWTAASILWGARLADIITDTPDTFTLDLTKFHDVVATPPTEAFPYEAREP